MARVAKVLVKMECDWGRSQPELVEHCWSIATFAFRLQCIGEHGSVRVQR